MWNILSKSKSPENLTGSEFERMMSETADSVILDVRTNMEHKERRIPNSINLDIYSQDFPDKIENLDKDKSYFVYCHSGARSWSAAKFMTGKGFGKVYNLNGGILGWRGKIEG